MSDVKKPIETLRDGNVKAAIWENKSKKGKFHSVTFSRSYRDSEGNYADTNSYSGADLLKLSRVAEQSYEAIQERSAAKRNATRSDYAQEERKITQEPSTPDHNVER